MTQAIDSTRPGGSIGYVGVPHGVTFDGQAMFFSQRRMRGGPAPVRRFLPDLMDRVLKGRIKPGKVFDLTLPIAAVASDRRGAAGRIFEAKFCPQLLDGHQRRHVHQRRRPARRLAQSHQRREEAQRMTTTTTELRSRIAAIEGRQTE